MELNFEKVKVLLVDDDNNFAFALKALLKAKGLEIESFSNPEEALEFLKSNKFDIILLDYYMPEMTGEQFLTELRKFDKGTIVFLQTAFSEEKPQFEMLQSLNIQGYIDKNKEPDDIFLDIVSGVKMANLLNVIKKQENEIAKMNYKKAIMGNLIVNLINEAKDQLMQIGGMNEAIKMSTNEFETENRVIEQACRKTYELYEALNFESMENCSIEKFIEIVNILVKPTIMVNNSKLDIKNENNSIIIENVKENIYFIIKIAEILTRNTANDIVIELKENENKKYFEIKYSNGVEINSINEIKLLDENRKIENEVNKINLYI